MSKDKVEKVKKTKVPAMKAEKKSKLAEIKTKLMSFAANLKTQPGISNVSMQINDFDLIVKIISN